MKKKFFLAIGIALAALALSGCLNTGGSVNPELRVRYGEDRHQVAFEVVGGKAVKYVWDFGDGTTEETTVGSTTHQYQELKEYLVVLKGYGKMNSGDGGPGPGVTDPERLAFELHVFVDTRPAFEIIGFKVTVVDPVPWYVPGAPAWPEWYYPCNCQLRFELLYKRNRPEEADIMEVKWLIMDASQYSVIESAEGTEWIWYDATWEFQCTPCTGIPREYRVYVAVKLTNGDVVSFIHSIYACGPAGSGHGLPY